MSDAYKDFHNLLDNLGLAKKALGADAMTSEQLADLRGRLGREFSHLQGMGEALPLIEAITKALLLAL